MAEIRITCGVYSFRAGWISKGAGRTVLSMVSLILVTGLAIWMNPYVTDVLNERTELPQYVEKKCLETFENNEFLSGKTRMCRRNGWRAWACRRSW